jgi:hypothetical protein
MRGFHIARDSFLDPRRRLPCVPWADVRRVIVAEPSQHDLAFVRFVEHTEQSISFVECSRGWKCLIPEPEPGEGKQHPAVADRAAA